MELPRSQKMITVKTKDTKTFKRKTDAWLASVRSAAQGAAAGLAYHALVKLAANSPQYSGDFVANWNVSGGAPNLSFKEWSGSLRGWQAAAQRELSAGGEPFKQGDRPAIEYALARGKKMLAGLAKAPLGTTIYIANASEHDGDAYAYRIEQNKIEFRDVNIRRQPYALIPRSIDYVMRRYKNIGKAELDALRRIGV